MPLVFAGDPAPQQLTAPCRKYSGRQRHPIEQVAYRSFFKAFCAIAICLRSEIVLAITNLIVGSGLGLTAVRGVIRLQTP